LKRKTASKVKKENRPCWKLSKVNQKKKLPSKSGARNFPHREGRSTKKKEKSMARTQGMVPGNKRKRSPEGRFSPSSDREKITLDMSALDGWEQGRYGTE